MDAGWTTQRPLHAETLCGITDDVHRSSEKFIVPNNTKIEELTLFEIENHSVGRIDKILIIMDKRTRETAMLFAVDDERDEYRGPWQVGRAENMCCTTIGRTHVGQLQSDPGPRRRYSLVCA
ncbi:hypothetical protein QTP88_007157 [Uroleucon formosanum]